MSWPLVPFADLLEDVTGGNEKTKQSDYAATGAYPIVDQGQALIGGYTDDTNCLCKTNAPVIIFGDHTKAIKYIDFPFCLGADGTKVLRPKLNADTKYLYYALHNIHIPDAGYSRHFKYLKAGKIPLPPLEEQKRIAGILDQADALRRLRTRALDKLNTLGQAIFHDMFGDVVRNTKGWADKEYLESIADIASGITKGRKTGDAPLRTVPYMAVSNVQDQHLKMDVVKEIEATETEICRYLLKQGDLLLTEGGDPDKLGRGCLWGGELPECIHQNHVFRVRISDERVKPIFLQWLVGSQRGKRYFLSVAKQTTGIASINKTQLKKFPLLLPPLELQNKFETRISALASSLGQQIAAATKEETLFASLQHRAFRGEL